MVNLLPPEAKQAIRRDYHFRVATVALWALTVVFISGTAFLVPSIVQMHGRVRALEARETVVDRTTTATTTSESHNDELKKVQEALSTLEQAEAQLSVSELVSRFVERAGNDVRVSNILFASEKKGGWSGSVGGTARSREALIHFERQLKQISGVMSVRIPLENFAEDENIEFIAEIAGGETPSP